MGFDKRGKVRRRGVWGFFRPRRSIPGRRNIDIEPPKSETPRRRRHTMNTLTSIYQDIAKRTAGDIYIGVVGPARTGKSTFIKRFMETMVIPNIDRRIPPGAGPGRTAPERLRPDGDDRRAQVRPRGGGGDRHGGGRGLFRAAHRLRGLSWSPGRWASWRTTLPRMVTHPLVPRGDPHGGGRGDRHPEGHCRALHHRHRGHHRRHRHRPAPGGLPGGGGPGDLASSRSWASPSSSSSTPPGRTPTGPRPSGPSWRRSTT